MPTLDATVGSSDANSYATVSAADTYFDERLQVTGWTGESADPKERALIMATRRIDQEKFTGWKDTEGQALKWPRAGARDDDGVEFSTASIPEIVKQATYEMALHLLNKDDDSEDYLGPTGLEQFKEAKVGPLEVKMRSGFDAGDLPDNVARLLRPVIQTPGASARLLRA